MLLLVQALRPAADELLLLTVHAFVDADLFVTDVSDILFELSISVCPVCRILFDISGTEIFELALR